MLAQAERAVRATRIVRQAVEMTNLGSMFEVDDSGTFMGVPAATVGDVRRRRHRHRRRAVRDALRIDRALQQGCACGDASRVEAVFQEPPPPQLRSGRTGTGEDARVLDIGDVAWSDTDFEGNRRAIRETCESIIGVGAVPVVFGGDDSIPIPIVQAYSGRGPLTIVQIDAHIDWRDEVQGERWGLSSTMRRSSEMDHVGEMIQVGQRGVGSARPSDVADAKARGVHLISAHEVHRHGTQAVIDQVPQGWQRSHHHRCRWSRPVSAPCGAGPGAGRTHVLPGRRDHRWRRGAATIAGFDIVEVVPECDVSGIGADGLSPRRPCHRTHRRSASGQCHGDGVTDVQRVDTVVHRDPHRREPAECLCS